MRYENSQDWPSIMPNCCVEKCRKGDIIILSSTTLDDKFLATADYSPNFFNIHTKGYGYITLRRPRNSPLPKHTYLAGTALKRIIKIIKQPNVGNEF